MIELNKNSPQVRGLVRWYPITKDDGPSLVRDHSPHGKHAATNLEAIDFGFGPFSNPIIIPNASIDELTIPNPQFSGNQPLTVSSWLQPRTDAGWQGAWLAGQPSSEIIIRFNADGSIDFILNSFSTNDRATTAAGVVVSDGLPHLVHGVYDGTTISVTWDGVEVATAIPTGSYIDTGSDWFWPQRNTISNSYKDPAWDLRIRNVGLSIAERKAEFAPATRWDLYAPKRTLIGFPSTITEEVAPPPPSGIIPKIMYYFRRLRS